MKRLLLIIALLSAFTVPVKAEKQEIDKSVNKIEIDSVINDSIKNKDSINGELNTNKIVPVNNNASASEDKDDGSSITAIIFSIIGTLLVSFLVFLLLYRKLKLSFDDDEKDYLNEIEKLKQESANQTNRLNGEIKTIKTKNSQLQKENEELKLKISNMQQKDIVATEIPTQNIVQEDITTPKLPISLYSDYIIDGVLNNVVDKPNEDTNFELVLDENNPNAARVIVYSGAHPRILANPAFIEGCEKQILSDRSTSVVVVREGVAQKDNTGKWILVTAPKIEIR